MKPPNKGYQFSYVRIRKREGEEVHGVLCLDLSNESCVSIWKKHDFKTTLYSVEQLTILNTSKKGIWKYLEVTKFQKTPTSIYEEFNTTTGGIGPHVRMQVIFPDGNPDKKCSIFVPDLQGKEEKFETFISTLHGLEKDDDFSYLRVEQYNKCKILVIEKRARMPFIIAKLAWEGFSSFCLDESEYRVASYFADKMTRARHMWVAQFKNDKTSAGPVRDAPRFRMTFLPPNWNLSFTLEGLSQEILNFPNQSVDMLILPRINEPLRTVLRNDILKKEKKVCIPPLSKDQMMQLHMAVYNIDYAPIGTEEKEKLKDIILIYYLHGYHGRICGKYKKTGKFRGFGEHLRNYREEKSSGRKLTTEALNRIHTENGMFKGRGGRGYKGIKSEREVSKKIYKPKWNMKRSNKIDRKIRSDIQQ